MPITLRGHPTGQGRDRIDDYANDLCDWVSRQGIDSFLLVGHSMGGAIAQDFAKRYPDAVNLALANFPEKHAGASA